MHENFHDLLQQYIDGELESLETIILEEHLSTCPSCRRFLNQLKLTDWDLKHQPVIDIPSELESHRRAAITTHLASVKTAEKSTSLNETWRLQKHILQHTFSFISYNPVNHTVSRSVKKTFSTITRAAGNRLRKRKTLLSRLIPGQA